MSPVLVGSLRPGALTCPPLQGRPGPLQARARESIRRIGRRSPASPKPTLRLGKYQEALSFRRPSREDWSRPAAARVRGRIYAAMGRTSEALAEIERIERDNTPAQLESDWRRVAGDRAVTYAAIYAQLGRADEAIAALEQGVEAHFRREPGAMLPFVPMGSGLRIRFADIRGSTRYWNGRSCLVTRSRDSRSSALEVIGVIGRVGRGAARISRSVRSSSARSPGNPVVLRIARACRKGSAACSTWPAACRAHACQSNAIPVFRLAGSNERQNAAACSADRTASSVRPTAICARARLTSTSARSGDMASCIFSNRALDSVKTVDEPLSSAPLRFEPRRAPRVPPRNSSPAADLEKNAAASRSQRLRLGMSSLRASQHAQTQLRVGLLLRRG